MKKLLLVMTMLVMGSAVAGEIIVFDKSWYEIGHDASVTQQFGVNEEMGRAWIEFSVSDNDPDSTSQQFRTKVEGLIFEVASSSVVIDHEGQIITCANVVTKGRSIFKTRVVKTNGRCKFEGKWREISYDDGYEIKKTYKYMIKMIID